MPLRVPIDLGDDEANELYVLGVSIPTINLMFREVAAYVATLTESERRERARIARKIRKSGKI